MEEVLKQIAEYMKGQNDIMTALANKELHTKTPATTGTAPGYVMPGGMFATTGVDNEVLSAYIRSTGIANVLPLMQGNEDRPRYASFTGFTATTGSRPVNPCDDSPAGFSKGCMLTARFGRTSMDTQTIEIDKIGHIDNRGVTTDLRLRGRLLGLQNLMPGSLNEADFLNIVTVSEMITAGVNLERDLMVQMWQGNPQVATAGGGYKQFPGLDMQIATGQMDVETGVLCPALDSDVKNFGYDLVGGTGRSIVEYVQMMEWYLRFIANRTGMDPVSYVLAMTPNLWFALTEIWPCAYNTNRCATAVEGTSTVILDGRENITARDQMRTSMQIQINGRTYPVIVDDGIFEHNNINNANLNPGEFASSIYFVPLTVTGGFPVTYREYVDYRVTVPREVQMIPGGPEMFWTDDGIYLWTKEQIKYCYKLSAKTEQRVVLRAPQLAGRIDYVKYSPLQHLRQPLPDDPYNFNGGGSTRPQVDNDYAVWLGSQGR